MVAAGAPGDEFEAATVTATSMAATAATTAPLLGGQGHGHYHSNAMRGSGKSLLPPLSLPRGEERESVDLVGAGGGLAQSHHNSAHSGGLDGGSHSEAAAAAGLTVIGGDSHSPAGRLPALSPHGFPPISPLGSNPALLGTSTNALHSGGSAGVDHNLGGGSGNGSDSGMDKKSRPSSAVFTPTSSRRFFLGEGMPICLLLLQSFIHFYHHHTTLPSGGASEPSTTEKSSIARNMVAVESRGVKIAKQIRAITRIQELIDADPGLGRRPPWHT